MSIMDHRINLVSAVTFTALLAPFALSLSPLQAQESAGWAASDWDKAYAATLARPAGDMAGAISQWEALTQNANLTFASYANFIRSYPGMPQQERLQRRAENAMADEPIAVGEIVSFFDRFPPITNLGRARYALALSTLGRPEALPVARAAWRGGAMTEASELYIQTMFGANFTADDHLARMDALLWQEQLQAAKRQLIRLPEDARSLFTGRIMVQEGAIGQLGELRYSAAAQSDPGFIFDLSRYYRKSRQGHSAAALLANRPAFAKLPFDAEVMVGEMLRAAKSGSAGQAVAIAKSVDDLFASGTDVSKLSYDLRDDYTSLMWLGATKALWEAGDISGAAPLFYRYGAAAQTPQTRSKGFYWAGLASQLSGDNAEATRYFTLAAAYSERFYGQLALSRLGRTMPALAAKSDAVPSSDQRAAFQSAPLTRAVREVARGAPWKLGIRFYQEIATRANTKEEHALVLELAHEIGRRDLAVNIAEAAGADGHRDYIAQGFPILPVPEGANWTMVHAISRQESQFAQNALSHAGARGLMQLMPGTAREQAVALGLPYVPSDLVANPTYNMQLGNRYINLMIEYYGGSYPLAIAAYNAGPGNVNKWLRANGDPRKGGIDWVTWIERIPLSETRNYVQRVIENAAVYEQLYPGLSTSGRGRMAGEFLF